MATEPVDHINERDQRLLNLRNHFQNHMNDHNGEAEVPLKQRDLHLLVEVLTDGI